MFYDSNTKWNREKNRTFQIDFLLPFSQERPTRQKLVQSTKTRFLKNYIWCFSSWIDPYSGLRYSGSAVVLKSVQHGSVDQTLFWLLFFTSVAAATWWHGDRTPRGRIHFIPRSRRTYFILYAQSWQTWIFSETASQTGHEIVIEHKGTEVQREVSRN